ncbi:DNA polymerase III subunit beta [uncultured Sphingomonas sp.]|uniref:DNA polymerase III subunit beta n=1 Tax=uncultured Sphingomonas sp. TaxID=158754 RepID=UPI0025ECBA0B|nr:DNA polymerase III subunit beta [uncultured Sphingomonas sp.]
MSLTVQRDALLSIVRNVTSVVEARNTIPILSNMLIEADGGRVQVAGTDLDVQVRAGCEGEGLLSITVPAGKLQAALDSLKPGVVKMELVADKGALAIKQGRSTRTLPTLPVADFPELPVTNAATRFVMPARTFERLFETVQAAQSSEEARYYLKGVFLHVVGDKLVSAACDGHRLLRCEVDLPDDAAGMPDMIVSSKTIGLLRKLVAGGDADVTIEAGRDRIVVAAGPLRITAKLVAATYPDYQRTIPSGGANVLTAGRNALIATAQAASAISGEKVRSLRIELTHGAEPEFITRDGMGAHAVEPLPGEYAGAQMAVGINAKYLISLASSFHEASVLRFELGEPSHPIRISAEAEPDLVAVCMPMRA